VVLHDPLKEINMTWDSVPWFVGGGAEHSPEVARLLAYAATGGVEGVISPGDLKVAPLAVPGNKVRVLAGAAIIRSDAAGGAQQSYVARNVSEDVVDIAATGSGSGRSDLIVASVEDPFMAGEPYADPANPKVGPYIYTRVIPNVAPGTTVAPSGSTAIALARIDIPANTATITAGMVNDLRQIAQPRRQRRVAIWRPGDVLTLGPTGSTTSPWTWLPRTNELIPCPEWATQVKLIVSVANLLHIGDLTGGIRAEYGWNGSGELVTPVAGLHHTDFTSVGERDRVTIVAGGELTIPPAMRGKSHYVRTGTSLNPSTGRITVDTWTTVTVDLEFVEVAE
jgi:hypothetical protein